MKRIVGLRIIKTGIGAALAMAVAQALNLSFMSSAGVITILSIQNTKRESLVIAIRRLIATFIALLIGSSLFLLLGFSPWVFGIYVVLMIYVATKLKVSEGIVPASVLVTHLLGQGYVDLYLLINEVLLMVVGAGVALLLNLYMPSIEKELLKEKHQIEEEMYDLIEALAKRVVDPNLKNVKSHLLVELKELLDGARQKASDNSNNYFFKKTSLYEKYFEMRNSQYHVVKNMYKHFEFFSKSYAQNQPMSDLLILVAKCMQGKVIVEVLIERTQEMRQSFKESKLPTTREEFENRAMLFQVLNDIERFLDIKKEFKDGLSEKEREEYGRYYKK